MNKSMAIENKENERGQRRRSGKREGEAREKGGEGAETLILRLSSLLSAVVICEFHRDCIDLTALERRMLK